MPGKFVMALDQGTGGSGALIIDQRGAVVASAERDVRCSFPQPGWVEQDAEEIVAASTAAMAEALARGRLNWSDIAALGIANQRETTIVWDRSTGAPVGPAIVWQCRRTVPLCAALADRAGDVKQRTGLPLDPYFSGTKIRWLLDQLPDGQRRAEDGELLFGTVDTWLLWRLTGGRNHLTDYTNASRTMLFNIHTREWDENLLAMLDIPRAVLPQVRASCGVFGETDAGIPVLGIAGDQQAALFGQACFAPHQSKNTYGTGAFLVLNTGDQPVSSAHGLITTLAVDGLGQPCYALEGAVFTAGSAIQWLRDGLGLIRTAAESETVAQSVADTAGVTFVPAFAGLGSPYWDPAARGTMLGLTAGTAPAHIVRAALEAIAYQSADLVRAMLGDTGASLTALRADGGGAANAFLMQFQADVLDIPVEVPANRETTAVGAAYLAGLAAGVWSGPAELSSLWRMDRRYEPRMSAGRRDELLATWARAVERARQWAVPRGTANRGAREQAGL